MDMNDQIKICLIIIFVILLLVCARVVITDLPKEIKSKEKVDYTAYSVNTQIYKEGMKSPRIDKITDLQQLYNYLYEFENEQIEQRLEKYNNKYFSEKGLIIVTIQEESSEVKNTLSSVNKVKNNIDIKIDRKRPQTVIFDTSMNHFIIEVKKDVITNAQKILINGK